METRLKELLQEKGMMSKTLAEKMGLSEVAVSDLVNGRNLKRLETLAKAAECLGVPLWQLFKDPEDETPAEPGSGNLVCPHCGKIITIKCVQCPEPPIAPNGER